MYCSECGYNLSDDVVYCPRCGTKRLYTVDHNISNENVENVNRQEGLDYGRQRSDAVTDHTKQKLNPLKKWGKTIALIGIIAILILCGTLFFVIVHKSDSNSDNNTAKETNHDESPSLGENIAAGDIIKFGYWEQDDDSANGAEPLEWEILETQDGKALMLSRCILDCVPYDGDTGDCIWEKSEIRTWLNSNFYDAAFSDSEKEAILKSTIKNPGFYMGFTDQYESMVGNTSEGMDEILMQSGDENDSDDYVFLLSVDEVKQYYLTDEERKSRLTEYGRRLFIENGIEQARKMEIDEEAVRDAYEKMEESHDRGIGYWWLRTSVPEHGCAVVVDYNGQAGAVQNVQSGDGGVRPAVWISLEN